MRYITHLVEKDLNRKMVFISGPRQCGKTTLCKRILAEKKSGVYLNWDDPDQKARILNRDWTSTDKLIILDEIHKYARWKNFLKGTFDTQRDEHHFLITGSARLDIYKRGQDSMVGRYHSWRLHPFCLAELHEMGQSSGAFEKLLKHGGFPEPYLNDDATFTRRWRKERIDLTFREDIRDLERVREISLLRIFHDMLTQRAGQLLVASNLARDLEIAPKSAKHWLEILERTYVLFRVEPFSKNLARALSKPPKVYFFDNGEVEGDNGQKFENLVANHLLKRIQFLEDATGSRYSLHYVRDKEGHEVDFLICKEKKPLALIEAKWNDSLEHRSLNYFGEKLSVKNRIQLVATTKAGHRWLGPIYMVSAQEWLSQSLNDETVFLVSGSRKPLANNS